jgi:nucleoside-diphosphate-sugar epimerase
VAEENPTIAWRVNVDGLVNMLEAARENRCKLFFPSSIGAFGPSTPRDRTPQTTIQRPTTIYGVAKVSGELLCDYYASKYGVDARGLRLPGLISHVTAPGGGTTDYAVHIFHQALEVGRYACFLDAATRLPMMYMPDAVEAMIAIMNADPARLRFRNAYNVSSMSFTPAELAAEIRKHIPSFEIEYRVDALRQSIAESWPRSLDDSEARTDWGFSPRFDLPTMTTDMLTELSRKLMQTVSGNP